MSDCQIKQLHDAETFALTFCFPILSHTKDTITNVIQVNLTGI